MKIFMVAILSFVSFLFARIHCENLDRYGYENLTEDAKLQLVNSLKQKLEAEYRNECIAKGGKGSAFTIHPGRVVKVCADISGSASGYLRVEMLCDYCTGKKMDDKLKAIEEDCNNGCMESVAYCQKASLIYEGGWGGKIVNDDECGEIFPECLDNGSSSSEFIESSNSEDPESSSSEDEEYESSSSYAISSSSEEDVESSSSEDEIDSSSSEDDDDESSSSSEDYGNIFPCYVPNDDGGCSVDVYVSRSPMPMIETLKFLPNSRDEVFSSFSYENGEGYISIRSNIPSQKKGYWKPCYYDKNNCKRVGDELPPKAEGELYYCYGGGWGESTPMGCTSSNGVSVSITENLKLERVHGSFVAPINVTDEQVLEIANEAARLRADAPFFCVENGKDVEIGWITFGKDKNRTIEDVFDYIRPYFDKCRERLQSSSSQISSSSSSEKYSSSNGNNSSSSKTIELSSSSIEDKSSSSVYIEYSSSDFVYSSSDATFVAGEDQVYYPDQIFKDGLDNMEDGKCYSLNPARGKQHGWINTNAQDSWWWREVDCETGDKVDNNRVGACPGFPLDNVPGNSKNACFAYNGSCYKCNPDRGSECSNSWLWQGSFTSGNIGWWYERVDCYNPFDDEDVEECYEIDLSDDGIALLKRTEKDVIKFANLAENDIVNLNSTNYYYDVLGRNLRYHTNLGLEQPIYTKRNSKTLNILSKTTTLSGYVKGTPRMNVCIKKDKVEGVVKYLKIEGSLRIVVGNLHYQGNDERLIAHEKKHKEIWSDEKYKKSWNYVATVTTSQSIYEACLTAFERLWGMEVQDLLIDVYTRQNNWDDDDENNSCESRIDINHDLVENKAKLLSGACSRYRGR